MHTLEIDNCAVCSWQQVLMDGYVERVESCQWFSICTVMDSATTIDDGDSRRVLINSKLIMMMSVSQ